MATEGTIAFFSGNDVTLNFTVADEDNPPAAKNLTGATSIIFVIAKAQGKAAVLAKTLGAGITVTDAVAGEFEVVLTGAETELLGAVHQYYEAEMTDSASKTATVAYGVATITKNSIITP